MSDPASYSNVTEVRTNSLHIELDVDFERHVLRGYAHKYSRSDHFIE
jgi:hypothetical protein